MLASPFLYAMSALFGRQEEHLSFAFSLRYVSFVWSIRGTCQLRLFIALPLVLSLQEMFQLRLFITLCQLCLVDRRNTSASPFHYAMSALFGRQEEHVSFAFSLRYVSFVWSIGGTRQLRLFIALPLVLSLQEMFQLRFFITLSVFRSLRGTCGFRLSPFQCVVFCSVIAQKLLASPFAFSLCCLLFVFCNYEENVSAFLLRYASFGGFSEHFGFAIRYFHCVIFCSVIVSKLLSSPFVNSMRYILFGINFDRVGLPVSWL